MRCHDFAQWVEKGLEERTPVTTYVRACSYICTVACLSVGIRSCVGRLDLNKGARGNNGVLPLHYALCVFLKVNYPSVPRCQVTGFRYGLYGVPGATSKKPQTTNVDQHARTWLRRMVCILECNCIQQDTYGVSTGHYMTPVNEGV